MGDTTEARRVRSARAAYLRDLGSGRRSLRETLRRPPESLKTAYVWDLLMATHNLGPTGCRKTLAVANVDGTLLVGELTSNQRRSIDKALPKRAK